MNKFSSFLKNTFSSGINLFKTHRISMIVLLLLTGVGFSLPITEEIEETVDYAYFASDILFQVAAFLFFFFAATFLIDTLISKISGLKTILLAIGALLSFALSACMEDAKMLPMIGKAVDGAIGSSAKWALIIGLVAILWILSVFFCFKKYASVPFAQFMVRVFSKIFMRSIVYGIISNGVLILSAIFTMLLWGDFEVILFPTMILISGVFYIPAILEAFVSSDDEEIGFIKVLVKFVLLIMTLVAYAIIYIYMAKITITWDIPSNSIFGILTALFVISMPLAYMCTSYERKGFLQNMAYFLPLIFVPFIALQIYAVFARIVEHGLTPSRALGVAFILLEIIYILLYLLRFFKKKELRGEIILPIIAVFILILACIPGSNVFHLSRALDTSLVKSGIENFREGKFDSEEIKKMLDMYEYISKEEKYGNLPASNSFSEEDQKSIQSMHDYLIEHPSAEDYHDETDSHTWWENSDGWIDVSNYSKVIYVEFDVEENENGLDFANVTLENDYVKDDEKIAEINISGITPQVMGYLERQIKEDDHNGEETLDDVKSIQVDENSMFVFERIGLSYMKYPLRITDMYGTGWLLVK